MDDTTLRYTLREFRTFRRGRNELREVGADGSEGDVVAFARNGVLRSGNGVGLYADETTTQPIVGFSGSLIKETFEITDHSGVPLGSFRKAWKASVLRPTWHLSTVHGLTAVGRERRTSSALLRRVFDDVPFMVFHLDFVTDDGHVVLSIERRRTLLPRLSIGSRRPVRQEHDIVAPALPDGRRLDWRVVAAVGVATATETDVTRTRS